MNAHLFQAFFVVWRESVEALLVVGILHAWLRTIPEAGYHMFLWGGVAAGGAMAGFLAAGVYGVNVMLPAAAGDLLQVSMTAIATVLIVQMVYWMRRRAPSLRRELERSLADGVARRGGWAIGALAAIAVAREGSETVVFLFGIGTAATDWRLYGFVASAMLGAAAAAGTYAVLVFAGRHVTSRAFFRTTEVLLLLLGSSLALTTVTAVMELDLLPADWPDVLYLPVWDISALLPDDALGGLLFAVAGYRAQPTLLELGVFAAYWLAVFGLLRRSRIAPAPASA